MCTADRADLLTRHHQWPAIPGLWDFKGHITHSARWDHDYDYSHKRIAVIGNGSSGIQIVPQMAKLPGTHVTNFIRGPTWVTYRVSPAVHLGRPADEPNPSYLDTEKKLFAEKPTALRDHRRAIIRRSTKAFRMVALPLSCSSSAADPRPVYQRLTLQQRWANFCREADGREIRTRSHSMSKAYSKVGPGLSESHSRAWLPRVFQVTQLPPHRQRDHKDLGERGSYGRW